MSKEPFYNESFISPDGSITVTQREIMRAAHVLAKVFMKRWETADNTQRHILASAALSGAMGYIGVQETLRFIQNPYFRQCVEALVETFEKFRVEGKIPS